MRQREESTPTSVPRGATFSCGPTLICVHLDDLDLTLKPPQRAQVPYQEYHVSQKFVNIISNCPESIRSKVLIMQSGNLRPPGSTFLGPFRRRVSVWTGARFRVRRPPPKCSTQRCDFPNKPGQTRPHKIPQRRHQRAHFGCSDQAAGTLGGRQTKLALQSGMFGTKFFHVGYKRTGFIRKSD